MHCNELVESYIDWLRQRVTVKSLEQGCEITTPFLDRHNDYLQIYAREAGDKIELTDAGYVLTDLSLAGLDLASPRRREMLSAILRGFGVTESNGHLTVLATKRDFPAMKHALVQAMLSVNDMMMVTRETVMSLFIEEVERFLNLNEVRFTPSVQFTGKSGFAHKFDFVIPKSAKRPERIIRTINSPSKDRISSLIFSWTDTRETRPNNSVLLAVMNDYSREIGLDLKNACTEYGIVAVPWSIRDEYLGELTA